MKHSTIIQLENKQSIKLTVAKLDEFLREYWGNECYFINSKLAFCSENTKLQSTEYGNSFAFTAFQDSKCFEFLKNNGESKTLYGEIFSFNVENNRVEIILYNRFDTMERERQFLKIANNIELALIEPFPILRFKENGKLIVKCKHRGSSKIGFDFIPCNDFYESDNAVGLFIYQTDFEYLYQFIKPIFPQKWNNMETFDYTSDNFVRREDWVQIIRNIKIHKVEDNKLEAFYKYIVDWIEKQLSTYKYICLYGNL